MLEDLKSWFATSPIASALRTAFALGAVSALNFVSEQYLSWGLPLVVQLAIASVIPPVLRAFNDADGIWGLGTTAEVEEDDEDLLDDNAPSDQIEAADEIVEA